MSIPRIIHQTWKTENIPSGYQNYVSSIRDCNQNYEHRLWTDNDNRSFIVEHYPWFLATYDAYRHNIERADAIRYFLLYHFGGVYIDLDMECLQSIDPLLVNGDVILSVEAGPSIRQQVVSNAFMAAAPHHPFFLHIIQYLAGNERRDITFQDVFEITGPNMVMSKYAEYKDSFLFRILNLNEVCPAGVLNQHPDFKDMSVDDIRIQKKLGLIHHNTESWNVQAQCPEVEIPGYTLFRGYDINGCDIEYIEYVDNSWEEAALQCSKDHNAVGFNYNGYIKGGGGQLEYVPSSSKWLKPGIQAWIYIKNEFVKSVSMTT